MKPVTLLIRFLLLYFMQLTIIRPIELGRWVDFYIYPLMILLLPINLRSVTVMLIAAVCGLSLDFMQNTPGLHAATAVALGFIRKPFLTLFIKPDDMKNDLEPMPSLMSPLPFSLFIGISFLFFHLVLYNIEAFRGGLFFFNLIRAVLNGLLALGLSWLLLLLFFKQGNK